MSNNWLEILPIPAERLRAEKRMQNARDRNDMVKERKDAIKKSEEENKLIQDTWDSLAGQGIKEELAKVELARKKEVISLISNLSSSSAGRRPLENIGLPLIRTSSLTDLSLASTDCPQLLR